jgi:hypothetical protein
MCAEHDQGGIIDGDEKEEKQVKDRLSFVINAIAGESYRWSIQITPLTETGHLFVDIDRAKKDMDAFAAANDARLYKLVKACVDPHSDLKTIVKSRVRTSPSCGSINAHSLSTSFCAGSSNPTPTSSTPCPSLSTTRRGTS